MWKSCPPAIGLLLGPVYPRDHLQLVEQRVHFAIHDLGRLRLCRLALFRQARRRPVDRGQLEGRDGLEFLLASERRRWTEGAARARQRHTEPFLVMFAVPLTPNATAA